MKVLVLFAHPDVDSGSIDNKVILDSLKDVEVVAVRELYNIHPNFKISSEAAEQ